MANVSSIKQNIYNNKRRIEVCEDEIAQLYKDISVLKELSGVLSQKRRKFNNIQGDNLAKVSMISALNINERITSPYSTGMRQSLSGGDYQSAEEGLNLAIRETDDKIFELEEELRQKQLQIDNLHRAISNLQYELQYAMRE